MITAKSAQGSRESGMTRLALTVMRSEHARVLRFLGVGGLSAMVQLGVMLLLSHHGWAAPLANICGIVAAAEVNFVLSRRFTWHGREVRRRLWHTWAMFHASIAGTATLNMLVFTLAGLVTPTFAASVAGIAVGAIGNFCAGDRLIFAPSRTVAVEEPLAPSIAS